MTDTDAGSDSSWDDLTTPSDATGAVDDSAAVDELQDAAGDLSDASSWSDWAAGTQDQAADWAQAGTSDLVQGEQDVAAGWTSFGENELNEAASELGVASDLENTAADQWGVADSYASDAESDLSEAATDLGALDYSSSDAGADYGGGAADYSADASE